MIIILGMSLYTYVQDDNGSSTTVNPTSSPIADLETLPEAVPDSSASPETDALLAGGSTYLDPQGLYQFLYPADYSIDHEGGDQYTRLIKRAETQRPQSELTDGVLIVFESVDLQGQSLVDWTAGHIKETTAAGSAELSEAQRAVVLSGYSGYTYETTGFGSSTNLVLQRDLQSQNAVKISFVISDPQQRNYQAEVDAVLATLKLLK